MGAGALIAKRLRKVVFERLQLTCSAGVAHNKILAKLASARHKPNKQALVLPRGVRDMMQVGWDLGCGLLKCGAGARHWCYPGACGTCIAVWFVS